MNLLSIAIKSIRRSKFMYAVSAVLIAICIILFNTTYSSVRTLFSQLEFASGLNDETLYVSEANASYSTSCDRELTAEESSEFICKILDGYCKEMNLDIEKGSEEYYDLMGEYDCMARWYTQHREEIGDGFIYNFYDDFIELLEKSGEDYSAFFTYSMLVVPFEFKNYECRGLDILDYDIARRLNMSIISGKDLKDTVNKGNTIEAVAVGSGNFNKKVKIGDTFEISMFNYNTNEYETYTVRIAGLIGSPYYLLDGYASFVGEEYVTLDTLTLRRSFSSEDSDEGVFHLMILPFEGFNAKYYDAGFNPIYFFSLNNVSEDGLDSLMHSLVSHGYDTVSAKKVYDNSFEEVKSELLSDIVIIVLSFVLSSLTMCGTVMLYIYDNFRSHYIMMMCGAKLKHHVIICVFNTGIMCIVSAVLSFLYFWLLNVQKTKAYGELFRIQYDYNNLLITLLLIIVSIILTVIISTRIFRFNFYPKHKK